MTDTEALPEGEREPAPAPEPEPAREPETERVLVDPDDRGALAARIARKLDEERLPVIPSWLRDKREAAETAKWAGAYSWHVTAYHGVRLPIYYGRALFWTPRGVYVLCRRAHALITVAEERELRSQAIAKNEAAEYQRLEKLRQQHIRKRGVPALLALVVLAVAVPWVAASLPAWAFWAMTAGLVLPLGRVGVPGDRRLAHGATVSSDAPPKLTADIVTQALASLDLAGITRHLKEGRALQYPAPIMRDGPGWLAQVDLPLGVTATDVMERREKLSASLRRPLGCVWPEADPDVHEGRLNLWVGDRDLRKTRQRPWGLLSEGIADVFEEMDLGTDYRGRVISMVLMFANVLIGAIPRQGKTFTLRIILLFLALDPRVELRVFELKGTGDLDPLEKVCHHYGASPSDEVIEACVQSLREVHKDLLRRAETIAKLPKTMCPENKVTSQLANRRDLGLHPVAVAVDECQELFTHPEYGKEAAKLCTAIIKRGPAMGVILLLATQRPDSESLPKAISANVGIRMCHMVTGQVENDMILGTSKYKQGIRATSLTTKDKGIGILVGAHETARTTRVYYVDGPAAEAVSLRARDMRETAGTLTGHALGEVQEGPVVDLLDDLRTVFVRSERADRMHSEDVCAVLAEMRPEVYSGWTANTLAAAVKPYGLTTGQLNIRADDGTRSNRRGLTREAVEGALDRVAARALDEPATAGLPRSGGGSG